MKHLPVPGTNTSMEKRLGDLLRESIRKNNPEIETESAKQVLDSIKKRICAANGVIYLERVRINPRGYANIMEKLAVIKAGMPKQMEWISSHPDSKGRALTILTLAAVYHTKFTPACTDKQWQSLKDTAHEQQ